MIYQKSADYSPKTVCPPGLRCNSSQNPVICLICASAAGVLIHFMELKIFLALGYHGDHARFVNSIILWDINEDICFLKADSGYVKGWRVKLTMGKKRLNFRLLNDLKLPRISFIQCVADLFPLTTETFGSEGPIEKISESIKQILGVFSGSGRDAKDESWKYWCKWAVAAGRPSWLMIIRDYTTQYIWDCHNSY